MAETLPKKRCDKFADAQMRQRIKSSLVLGPLAALGVYIGGALFYAIVGMVVLLGFIEWIKMVRPGAAWSKTSSALMLLIGVPYLAGSGLAMAYVRTTPESGMALTFYLLFTVWGTDIGAFLAGRLIGGPKLLPSISPKKTWAGLAGGMAFAALVGYGVALGFGASKPCWAAGLSVVLAAVAQAGDFFESWVKRRSGVKDSGDLIPGHGGILDRIDGLLFAAAFIALYLVFNAGKAAWW